MASHGQRPEAPTGSAYRALLVRGFTPGEAANLVAWIHGIQPDAGRAWRIAEVDRLLFLRSRCMARTIGLDDGLTLEERVPAV